MWRKITKIFRRLPADQASLRDDLQRFAPATLLRQFPKDAPAAERLDLSAFVHWALARDGRGLEETLSLGADKSAESMIELGDRVISAAFAESLASAISVMKESELPALSLDLILAAAFERALNEENPGLGSGTFPDAARVAAGTFMARAIRWSQPERALGVLAALPNQPGLEAVLALPELEAWLLARKALLGRLSPESWQSDLAAARRLLESFNPGDEKNVRARDLDLAQVMLWSGEAEGAQEQLKKLASVEDFAAREQVELLRGLWSLQASESPELEQRFSLAQLEVFGRAIAELVGESEDEVGQGERSERLWSQAEHYQKRLDDALEASASKKTPSASLRLIHARRKILNDEFAAFEDGSDVDGALRELNAAIETKSGSWILYFDRAQLRLHQSKGELEIDSKIYKEILADLELAAAGEALCALAALASFRLQASLLADESQSQALCELAWKDFTRLLEARPDDHASLSGAIQCCPHLEELRALWSRIDSVAPSSAAEKAARNELTALASNRFQELGDEETGTSLMKSLVGQELEALQARERAQS